jgi:hypothetical protein
VIGSTVFCMLIPVVAEMLISACMEILRAASRVWVSRGQHGPFRGPRIISLLDIAAARISSRSLKTSQDKSYTEVVWFR